jgi:hypothetical protein
MIDEEKAIVIDNFQSNKGVTHFQKFRSQSGDEVTLDISLKITVKSAQLILAHDDNGAILITKDDGKFVRSFVTPFPLNDGKWVAFGNTLWGTCTRSPFN